MLRLKDELAADIDRLNGVAVTASNGTNGTNGTNGISGTNNMSSANVDTVMNHADVARKSQSVPG